MTSQMLPAVPWQGGSAVLPVYDTSNCANELIRAPGSIQPHGVLFAMAGVETPIVQVSANVGGLTGREPVQVLGSTLGAIFTAGTVMQIAAAIAGWHPQTTTGMQQQIRVRVRLGPTIEVHGPDAELNGLLHRSGQLWILEVEPSSYSLSVDNTYDPVRSAVTGLGRADDLDSMYDIAVREIRQLTGFDRVMLYRFDADWNGQVHAEAKRHNLTPYLGLQYPAGDIPAQARQLYTETWLRFVRDVDAVNAPVIPAVLSDGQPLDLSFASLRSLSPLHCQYLRNMGVAASMSLSLIIGGKLVGLIACQHCDGPYVPAPAVRAACEVLAQTLSLRIAAGEQVAHHDRTGLITATLSELVSDAAASGQPLALALQDQGTRLLEVFGAIGMALTLDGVTRTHGTVPEPVAVAVARNWGRHSAVEGMAATAELAAADASFASVTGTCSGALALVISDDQDVVFFRPEAENTIDWGRNPYMKSVQSDPTTGPDNSFQLWREAVTGRSQRWEQDRLAAGRALRVFLMQHMLLHARDLAGVAEILTRSLLPDHLPQPAGWQLAAESRPAATGVGGDWYDAFPVSDDRLLLVVGDVAGHGLAAASAMAQLRNALRAYAFEDPAPAALLARLDRLTAAQPDEVLTTVVLALLTPGTGRLEVASAGHPAPLWRRSNGVTDFIVFDPRPPLGIGFIPGDQSGSTQVVMLEPGDAVVLYSDGVVERREEDIEVGLGRLRATLASGLASDTDAAGMARVLFAAAQPQLSADDTTLLLVQRVADSA